MTEEELRERVADSRGRIAEILTEDAVAEPYRSCLRDMAQFLLLVTPEADNRMLYADILPDHYDRSYANPDFASAKLGSAMGPVLAAVYAELRGIIPAVFEGDLHGQAVLLELFLCIYFEFTNDEVPKADTIRLIFGMYLKDYLGEYLAARLRAQLVPEDNFAVRIIEGADLTDLSYLYRYGEYVTENTIRTAEYINSLPEETIGRMAYAFTEGFREGFVHAKKDLSKKRTVQIVYELGFERMMRAAFARFREMGLAPAAVRSSARLVLKSPNRHAGYTGAIPNLQFDWDHREDLALIFDENYATLRKRATREAFEMYREEAARHAGPAVLETFGEKPFEPETHPAAIRMDERRSGLFVQMKTELAEITDRYIPGTERSFTIIDFPVPAIGERFEEIFYETVRINTLDSAHYSRIQQNLIDALDRGYAVHVTGRNGNRTDLTVALMELTDPSKQTLFENCVADVNIPVGEVFTSPKLLGTNGILHVQRVFLNGYEFRDLEIRLKDGYIDGADCGNFATEEENREYIRENILFRHPTLTIGEFAIGTNTAAYVMARKYGIEAYLPILIAEKTGPHFAMGDTCYSFEEDNPVCNPDGKEIIARDNEHTLIRKTDPLKAYYGCHTDITIPYDELDEVTVLLRDGGEIPLLSGGRFVLPGTEELNTALDE